MRRRAVLAWFVFVAIGIANGAVHRATYGRRVSELRGHQISSVTGALALFGAAYAMLRRDVAGTGNRTLLGIGAGWTAATIAFEFLFGHYVSRDTWASLLEAYDVRRGRLWVLVPLTIFLSPLLVKRLVTRRAPLPPEPAGT